MKHKLILILALFLGVTASSFAQTDTSGGILTNPQARENFSKAYITDGTLFLFSTEKYDVLSGTEKASVLNTVFKDIGQTKLSITTTKEGGEIWIKEGRTFLNIDSWSNSDLNLANYQPIEVNRHGQSRWYNYYGGSLSGVGNTHSLMANYRRGTFLYKDYLDVAASISGGGYVKGDDLDGSLAVGVSSRGYLPFRLEDIRLAPYVGVGCSMPILPDFSFELQLLAGACWFVGPGSLDFGLQYGTKSKAVFTIGYTFRPSL